MSARLVGGYVPSDDGKQALARSLVHADISTERREVKNKEMAEDRGVNVSHPGG